MSKERRTNSMTKQALFATVKEVKETKSINEVNSLIEEGWILLHVMEKSIPLYSMGRTC